MKSLVKLSCFAALLFTLVGGCAEQPTSDESREGAGNMSSQHPTASHHPVVDLEHWASIFPLESFQKTSGPRRFDSSAPDDPVDLWKPHGTMITSPIELCQIELVRREYASTKDLGRAVPVDIFLWSVEPAKHPYLTKLGGIPHRESTKPWPIDASGKPCTFVAQFCFADSRDIISDRVPDDVMLIFFEEAESIYARDGLHIEWSSIHLESPLTSDQCPPPSFPVPELSGVIYRCNESPDSGGIFEQEGHDVYYLFPATQSTKIGRETYYIQHDVRGDGEELLCVLNSVYPSRNNWPFIGLKSLPKDWDQIREPYGWGAYQMLFADVGCLYFVIDEDGNVDWSLDSY